MPVWCASIGWEPCKRLGMSFKVSIPKWPKCLMATILRWLASLWPSHLMSTTKVNKLQCYYYSHSTIVLRIPWYAYYIQVYMMIWIHVHMVVFSLYKYTYNDMATTLSICGGMSTINVYIGWYNQVANHGTLLGKGLLESWLHNHQ